MVRTLERIFICSRLFLLSAVLALFTMSASGQDEDSVRTPLSNLEVFQHVARDLAGPLVDSILSGDPSSIGISIAPGDLQWFLEEPFDRSFRKKGWSIKLPDSAHYRLDIGVYELRIAYANPHRTGFLGSRVVDRVGVLGLNFRLTDLSKGNVFFEGRRGGHYEDVVELSSVTRLEHPAVPATHASLPAEDFFSGLGEPLIVLGSIAIAVFLLFTVRS
jgi:hypothetical protein